MISTLVPNLEIAMSLIPIILIPILLLGGLFVDSNNVIWFLKPIEFISFFRIGF